MRVNSVVCAIVVALASSSCGGSDATTGPAGDLDDGIEYSAQVHATVSSGLTPAFNMILTMVNRSATQQSKTYPAGCPVRTRIYRLLDNRLMYDETRLQCAVPTSAVLTLAPGQSRTLGAGSRVNCSVVGDSLVPNTAYRFTAVPQMSGATDLELEAGELSLQIGGATTASCPLGFGGQR